MLLETSKETTMRLLIFIKDRIINRFLFLFIVLLIIILAFSGCINEVFMEEMDTEKADIEPLFVVNNNTDLDREVISIISNIDDIMGIETSENEDDIILKHFDLSDPKIYWDGRIDIEFHENIVNIIMRKTDTYPKLELHDFGLSNAESIEYIFLEPNLGTVTENFRQILRIRLKEPGKENVIEAIRHLESLDFIRYAGPLYICFTNFEPSTYIPIDH